MFWVRCEESRSAPTASQPSAVPPTAHCHKGKGWWHKEQQQHHHHHHHIYVDGALWGSVPQPKHEHHHHCHRSRSFRPWCDKKNNENCNIQADQMQYNRFHGHFRHLQDDAAHRPCWFSHYKSRRGDGNVPKTQAPMFDYSENYN